MYKRQSVDYAWNVAIVAGAVTNMLVILVGTFFFELSGNIVGLILGNLVAMIAAFILQFFVFSVDYSRTEYVQYEDDDYYYYVKAVPKMNIAAPNVKVKKINVRRNSSVRKNEINKKEKQ